MLIYGLFIMAGCMLVGTILGDVLGLLLGLKNANVGGVGFAMLFLILVTDKLKAMGKFSKPAESGILFWSAIYIPVVVAMAATQNVQAALKGGWAAAIAGIGGTAVCFLLVKPLSRMGLDSAMKHDAKSQGA